MVRSGQASHILINSNQTNLSIQGNIKKNYSQELTGLIYIQQRPKAEAQKHGFGYKACKNCANIWEM